jgi:hypothetical protein
MINQKCFEKVVIAYHFFFFFYFVMKMMLSPLEKKMRKRVT